jgi:predicted DNA-binding protein (UPF0251 family)
VPRPKKPRFVSGYPSLTAFVPEGVPVTGEVFLSVEELEAVRLSDFEGLDQEAAANLMEVSRQTYGRILSHARGIISEALVTGKVLRVEGGDYEFRGMRRRRRRGVGRGQGRGSAGGDGWDQGSGRGRQS